MMVNFYLGLSFSSFLLGMLAVIILRFASQKTSYPNRVISVTLFCLAYFTLIVGLVDSGLILKYPHLFRTASPLFYLVPPTAFLYVRAVLNEERNFKWKDAIHFMPAILHFLELIPFYLQGTDEKIKYLQSLVVDSDHTLPLKEGLLPPFMHLFIQIGLGLSYFTWQAWLTGKYRRENAPLDKYQRIVFYWLSWLTAMLILCYGINLIAILLDTPLETVHHFVTTLLGSTLMGTVLYLFFKPQILYGFSNFTEAGNLAEEIRQVGDQQDMLTPEQIACYKEKIEQYLETEHPYLDTFFRMRTMEEATGIPRHHLSAVINNVYEMNFNRLINTYRVNHVKKHFNDPEWSNLTLEGIGMEAGFKSRSTFLNAFKKITGMTPSEFREQVQ